MKYRTPRNYKGVENPAKKMADLLPDLLKGLKQDCKEEVFRFWYDLMGETKLTEPIELADGVLTVKVKSSTLYSLLCQHEKPRLLERLKEKFPIRNLVFRVG